MVCNGRYIGQPKQLTNWSSRIARELAPGALQWGKSTNFGIPKFKENMTGWKHIANLGAEGINQLRAKGGQGLGVAYLVDQSINE